jgi:predicted RNA polymerase sigma factor
LKIVCVQDAFTAALEKWQAVPPNPGAWIVTTARNRAVDRLRRESTREARHAQALLLQQQDELARLGRDAEARAAYDQAMALATNETERVFLQTRQARLDQRPR